jgi:hypothetical protein
MHIKKRLSDGQPFLFDAIAKVYGGDSTNAHNFYNMPVFPSFAEWKTTISHPPSSI